jgi:hypothetical protein
MSYTVTHLTTGCEAPEDVVSKVQSTNMARKVTCSCPNGRSYTYDRQDGCFTSDDPDQERVKKIITAFNNVGLKIENVEISKAEIKPETKRAITSLAEVIASQLNEIKIPPDCRGNFTRALSGRDEDLRVFYSYVTLRNILVTNDPDETNQQLCKQIIEANTIYRVQSIEYRSLS